jgi:hypothetical protein
MSFGSQNNLYGSAPASYAAYRVGGFRGLPEDRGLAASITFYRANLVRRRDFCANPLYSTFLAQAPGGLLGIVGWVRSSPEQWFSAAGVGLFWVGLTLVTWRPAGGGADDERNRVARRLGQRQSGLGVHWFGVNWLKGLAGREH